MSIELPVTFVEGSLHQDLLNQQFAALLSAHNDVLARVETLEDQDTFPLWGEGAALAGDDFVAGGRLRFVAATVTLAAGVGTFTFATAYTGGVLSVQASVRGATPRACSVESVAVGTVDVAGTGTDNVFVTVIGWDY